MAKSINSERKNVQGYERCMEKHPEKIKEIASMYVSLLERYPLHGHELTLPMKYIKEYLLTGDIAQKGASMKMKAIAMELVNNTDSGLEPEEMELIKKSSSEHMQVAFYYLKNKDVIEFTGRSTYRLKNVSSEVKKEQSIEEKKPENQKVFVDVINNLSGKQVKWVVDTEKTDESKDQKPVSIIDNITNNIINPLKDKIKNTEKQLIETTAVNLKQRGIIDDYRERIFELEQIIKTKNLAIQTQERTTETIVREGNQAIADQQNQINELENKVKELQGLNTLRLKEEITGFKKEFDEISEWVNEMSIKVKEV
jgi:hypothetical protein